MSPSVFIGYDAGERLAWEVCAASLQNSARDPVPVAPIGRADLAARGLYTRPTSVRDGIKWDDLSNEPCSTDFSLARFWLPLVAERSGWALFCDSDFLWRRDVHELFALADPRYAVMVVPHQQNVVETVKMRGQPQTEYERKNWTSLMLWNLSHAGARRVSVGMLNQSLKRDLHQLLWLADNEIGFLPEEWNWLDGTSAPDLEAAAAHFTRGTPDMPNWIDTQYAGEWRSYADALGERARQR